MIITQFEENKYRIEITPWQCQLFSSLASELRESITKQNNPLVQRLFPIAYPDDPVANREFDSLVQKELLQSHLSALEILENKSEVEEFHETELIHLMQAINIVRIALGTRLDIHHEDDFYDIAESHPDHDLWVIYQILGEVLSLIVEALQV
ncbi:MAG: DUF2017 family protein [Acidimicrobiales bacterium]|nr:DUF2017 family protein [Acidimicrobiales bacterium]